MKKKYIIKNIIPHIYNIVTKMYSTYMVFGLDMNFGYDGEKDRIEILLEFDFIGARSCVLEK